MKPAELDLAGIAFGDEGFSATIGMPLVTRKWAVCRYRTAGDKSGCCQSMASEASVSVCMRSAEALTAAVLGTGASILELRITRKQL